MWNKVTFFVLLPSFEIGVMLIERYPLDSSKQVSPPLTQKTRVECREDPNSLTQAVCTEHCSDCTTCKVSLIDSAQTFQLFLHCSYIQG